MKLKLSSNKLFIQPTNEKGKPRHYGPIPSHHTPPIQSITFNWRVYFGNNTHDNSLYRILYSTHWQYRLTNDWVRSAVLVDVCKTQSFHCKKEQNVQINSDIIYISCGTDAENLTIKAFYYLLIISFSFPVIDFMQLIEQSCCEKKLIVGIRWVNTDLFQSFSTAFPAATTLGIPPENIRASTWPWNA